jgi:glucokinase
LGEPALAVDVGGTKIAYALIDGSGRVLDSGYVLTDRRGGRYVVEQVRDVVSRYSRVELAGVGVSVAGAVRGGAYVWAPNIGGWRWVDLRSAIQDSLGRSTRVEVVDDRVASVLGEVWQGSARGLRNVVTLIIGTGVGAGIMVEGVAVRGSSGVAGAVGWWLLSRRCRSRRSRRGFLEEVIGGVGLSKVAMRYASEEVLPGKTLREVCGELDARCLFKAYDLGAPFATRTLRRVAEVVGILVANLVSALNPEAVVLCGSVGVEMGRRFMDVIRGVVEAVAQPLALGSCSIRVSTLGNLSSLYGAAYAVLYGK